MTVRGPEGGLLRFVHGDRQLAPLPQGGYRPERLAHVNLNSVDVDASAAFYEKALGFRLTDRSKAMAFVRCNSDHHAVVIADAPVNGLNHVAFLMPDLEAVMRGAGRLIDAGFPPLMLEPIDFNGLYLQQLAARQQEDAAAAAPPAGEA